MTFYDSSKDEHTADEILKLFKILEEDDIFEELVNIDRELLIKRLVRLTPAISALAQLVTQKRKDVYYEYTSDAGGNTVPVSQDFRAQESKLIKEASIPIRYWDTSEGSLLDADSIIAVGLAEDYALMCMIVGVVCAEVKNNDEIDSETTKKFYENAVNYYSGNTQFPKNIKKILQHLQSYSLYKSIQKPSSHIKLNFIQKGAFKTHGMQYIKLGNALAVEYNLLEHNSNEEVPLRDKLKSSFGKDLDISGGEGQSQDDPIVITEACKDYVGTEYHVIELIYAALGREYEIVSQKNFEYGGRLLDQIKISVKGDQDNYYNFYFDVTAHVTK